MMNRTTLKVALRFLKAAKARRSAWEDACRSWAREGFAPAYCEHGTYLWTDYDPICGYCEDSWTVYDEALWHAKHWEQEHRKLIELLRNAMEVGASHTVTSAIRDDINAHFNKGMGQKEIRL